jgi:hypothetical protein
MFGAIVQKYEGFFKLLFFSILSDKNRTLFSLSFCLDTKERKNQVSIEAVRRKSLSDRYSKRVYALAYKRQALFGIDSASKFSSPSLCQSSPRFYEALSLFIKFQFFERGKGKSI